MHRENMIHSSCLKPQGIEPLYLVKVAPSSGTLSSLFELCYWGQAREDLGVGPMPKTNFSKYGHAAYQIKGNEAYNNMLANNLHLHKPFTPVKGSKGNFFLF